MALELIPTSRSQLGSDVLKGTTGQPTTRCLSNNIVPDRARDDRTVFMGLSMTACPFFSSRTQNGPRGVRIEVASQ